MQNQVIRAKLHYSKEIEERNFMESTLTKQETERRIKDFLDNQGIRTETFGDWEISKELVSLYTQLKEYCKREEPSITGNRLDGEIHGRLETALKCFYKDLYNYYLKDYYEDL